MMERNEDDQNRPFGGPEHGEECGVFAIYAPGADVARMSFFAIYALQHRGQESAGIVTSDGRSTMVHKGMGLVTQVFNEDNLNPLQGHMAIAHNRYSTTGGSHLRNAQPYLIETLHGPLGVAHNGNLANADELRRGLLERGVGLSTSTDSEAITQMLAGPPPGGENGAPDWEGRIQSFMEQAEGAYSLVVLTRDAIFAVRDPNGIRPLCLGRLPEEGGARRWAVASESCALATVGAELLRSIEPGEIVRIDSTGVHSIKSCKAAKHRSLCVFEYVYLARPDSILDDDQTVHIVRHRLGQQLFEESPVEADIVMGVPDSARSAAVGFANASGIPYSEGLIKNRYIGRTFIQPDAELRRAGARLKYNPVRSTLKDRRVVLVDDSIVRGNTIGPIVQLVREGGAKEVHVRVASPAITHPCTMGVDMATYDELIAYRRDNENIRRHIGADSLAYLSPLGLIRAVTGRQDAKSGPQEGFCAACFTGEYPPNTAPRCEETGTDKLAFEQIKG